jgi:hypothetical protein
MELQVSAFIPALSFRQPWIWTIFECGKRTENRVWHRKFRGQFLIHASKGMTKDEFESCYRFALEVGTVPGKYQLDPPRKEDLQFGGIVGRARIDADPAPPAPALFGDDDPWHMEGQWGYPLSAVERLVDAAGKPAIIPWRGALGFFTVPAADLQTAMADGLHFREV